MKYTLSLVALAASVLAGGNGPDVETRSIHAPNGHPEQDNNHQHAGEPNNHWNTTTAIPGTGTWGSGYWSGTTYTTPYPTGSSVRPGGEPHITPFPTETVLRRQENFDDSSQTTTEEAKSAGDYGPSSTAGFGSSSVMPNDTSPKDEYNAPIDLSASSASAAAAETNSLHGKKNQNGASSGKEGVLAAGGLAGAALVVAAML